MPDIRAIVAADREIPSRLALRITPGDVVEVGERATTPRNFP